MGVDFGREDQKIEDENEQEQDHEHEHDYDWWGVMSWARQPRKPRLRRSFALPEPDLLLAGNGQKTEDEDEQVGGGWCRGRGDPESPGSGGASPYLNRTCFWPATVKRPRTRTRTRNENEQDWWWVMSGARRPGKPRLRRSFALPEPGLLLAGNDQKIEDEDEQEQDHEHEHDYDWWRVVSGARQPGKPRFWRRFVVT
jgi:hypothetical protein